MRTTNRILIFSLLGIIFILGCAGGAAATPAAVYPTSQPASAQATQPLPEATEAQAQATQPTLPLPTIAPVFTALPAMPERRRLTLEFPPRMRAGDADIVRLMLEVDDLGNITPTAQIGGHVVTGDVIEIPNLYETHHVVAEARFDIAGMEISPPGLESAPLSQGNSAMFSWSIRPREVGDYRGTIWLYLQFVDKSSGEESRKTVSAQIVDIEAVDLLGLSGAFARTTGVVGSIVGTVIGFPFLEDIIKFLFRKRSKLVK